MCLLLIGVVIVLAYDWWTLFRRHLTSSSSDISWPRNRDNSNSVTLPPSPVRSSSIPIFPLSVLGKLAACCQNPYLYPLVYCLPLKPPGTTISPTSAKKYSVRAEWLRQSGRTPSEPSETPRWRITPRPASIQRVALYIALRSLIHCLFAFCRSPILNDHSGAVANCDNTLEWVDWVRACIGIAMRWVTLRISLLAFLLPARKMQFSLLIIHIIPSHQIYVAVDNPLLVPSVSCLTSSSYLRNYVRAADNISHAENLQCKGCRCFSH